MKYFFFKKLKVNVNVLIIINMFDYLIKFVFCCLLKFWLENVSLNLYIFLEIFVFILKDIII